MWEDKMANATSIFAHTWATYTRHFWTIFTLAVPGLLAPLIPILVGTPVYISLGGTYLRTGSIPDLTSLHIAVILAAFLLSLFLMAFAIVNVNLVVKKQRTMRNIASEVVSHISTTTLSVFWIFLVGVLLLFIAQLVSFEFDAQKALFPLLSLAIGFPLLFVPTAMVIDEARPTVALRRSVEVIVKKWPMVLLWSVIAVLSVSLIDFAILEIVPHPIASYLVLLANSLVILPFLIVLLAQIYISKYSILA